MFWYVLGYVLFIIIATHVVIEMVVLHHVETERIRP